MHSRLQRWLSGFAGMDRRLRHASQPAVIICGRRRRSEAAAVKQNRLIADPLRIRNVRRQRGRGGEPASAAAERRDANLRRATLRRDTTDMS